jgi:hypothetical protein
MTVWCVTLMVNVTEEDSAVAMRLAEEALGAGLFALSVIREPDMTAAKELADLVHDPVAVAVMPEGEF